MVKAQPWAMAARLQAKTPAGPAHFTPSRSTIQPAPRKAMAAASWNSEASLP